jgi:hypothetical protein
MNTLPQLALACRDARSVGQRLTALSRLSMAAAIEMSEIVADLTGERPEPEPDTDDDRPAPEHHEVEPESVPPARPKVAPPHVGGNDDGVPLFWILFADDCGETILVLTKKHSVVEGVLETMPYGVRESGATRWEKDNYRWRIAPDGTVTRKGE